MTSEDGKSRSGLSGSEWQGRMGDAWAREWRRTDRSFSGLTPQLNAAILAAAPQDGRAIDLGCGAGETSIALAVARPNLHVTGIDLSAELLAVATERGTTLKNLDFRVGDTAILDPATRADFFFSRHGVMFFPDPAAAFSSLRSAARPSAGLVFSCFAARAVNEWIQVIEEAVEAPPAIPSDYTPGPFSFADRDFVASMLANAGWVDAEPMIVEFNYIAGSGPDPVADAVDFFTHIGAAARVLAHVTPNRRLYLLDRLAKALALHESDGKIAMRTAVWIWTAHAGES